MEISFDRLRMSFKYIILTCLINFVIILIVSILNFNQLSKKYGFDGNNFRNSKGIPVIESDWHLSPPMGNIYRDWYISAERSDSCEFHKRKRVEFGYLKPLYEEDYFESVTSNNVLMTKYCYSSNKTFYYEIKKRGSISIEMNVSKNSYVKSELHSQNQIEVSKGKFDEILSDWWFESKCGDEKVLSELF